jgi:hypothetical protein
MLSGQVPQHSSSMPNGYLTTISQSSNKSVQDKFQEETKAVMEREKSASIESKPF